jgi:hypothetical protein
MAINSNNEELLNIECSYPICPPTLRNKYIKGKVVTRTNGSRRKPNDKPKLIQRWQEKGIKIGSMNVRGLTYLKLVVIVE